MAPNLLNKSFEIRAEILRNHEQEEGVLVAHGDISNGYSFFVRNNRLYFSYNNSGIDQYVIESVETLPIGSIQLRFQFIKSDKSGGVGKLYVGDRIIGSGHIPSTHTLGFPNGQFHIGRNTQSPISTLYRTPFEFQGQLERVIYFVTDSSVDLQAALAFELETE